MYGDPWIARTYAPSGEALALLGGDKPERCGHHRQTGQLVEMAKLGDALATSRWATGSQKWYPLLRSYGALEVRALLSTLLVLYGVLVLFITAVARRQLSRGTCLFSGGMFPLMVSARTRSPLSVVRACGV